MAPPNSKSYGVYEKQRLYRILEDFRDTRRGFNFSTLAMHISGHSNRSFDRRYFSRLKAGTLRDDITELIVKWYEANQDSSIREKLKPQAIFDEVGKSSHQYFFHPNDTGTGNDWDENVLEEYAGVYFCAPAWDKNSYLPLPFLRRWYKNRKSLPEFDTKHRSLDIKQYIQERTVLILQSSGKKYFYAAEFPLSILFPNHIETLDIKMLYEGIGTMSSNSIHVKLRECLSRVPKNHSIVIKPKAAPQHNAPYGFNYYLSPEVYSVRQDWEKLSEFDRAHLKKEQKHFFDDKYYLNGPVQICESPIPLLKNQVEMNFSRDYIYFRKSADFLQHLDAHFIKPDIDIQAEIKKIIDNPLSIGELI